MAPLDETAWHAGQRQRLLDAEQRLDALLAQIGFSIVGGTSLYRHLESGRAQALFAHMLRLRINVRRFAYQVR